MGRQFYNLNIYGAVSTAIADGIPESRIYHCAEKWLTVTSPYFTWGNTQKYAKAFSKSLGCPVLSTEYFDDDYVEFALYCAGKLITKHIPVAYENFAKKKGNAAKIIDCLALNLTDESALKKALAVSDCEESVHLIESFLGCPIFDVKDGAPPTGAPDRSAFDIFAGGKSEVSIKIQKNPAKADQPPYATEPDTAFIPGIVLNETIVCFTDKPEPVIRNIELQLRLLREEREWDFHHADREHPDPLWDHDIRILLGKNRVVIQGSNYGVPCAGDLSREFHCLTSVAVTGINGFFRVLDFGMGYGGKFLCRGTRGTAGSVTSKVLANMVLQSPFLSLPDGTLVAAFEAGSMEDAIAALEKLLDAPIRPIDPEDCELIKTGDHLRIFQLI